MKTLIVLALSGLAWGQSAKVASLSVADAAKAKTAYDALQKAQDAWKAVQTEIEQRYVSDSREEEEINSSSILSGAINARTLQSITGFECAAKDAYIIGGVNGSMRPSKEDPECVKARDRRKAEEALAAAKAQREADEQRAHPKMHTVYTPKPGWEAGFEFTPDFQFIVPKPPEPPKQIQWNDGTSQLGGINWATAN